MSVVINMKMHDAMNSNLSLNHLNEQDSHEKAERIENSSHQQANEATIAAQNECSFVLNQQECSRSIVSQPADVLNDASTCEFQRMFMEPIPVVHMQRYEKGGHKCPDCEKVFLTASKLLIHEHVHSNERMFPCKICTKSFKFKSGLSRHMKKQHPCRKQKDLEARCSQQNENSFCLEPGRTLQTVDNLSYENSHLEYEENSFEAENFGKENFEMQERSLEDKPGDFGLKDHEPETLGNNCELTLRPCRFCNEYFHYAKLWFHMERCEKAKVHKCSECEMVFRKPSSLVIHKRKHSDERLFHCEICRKSFKYKGGLTRHMKEQHGRGLKDADMTVHEIQNNGDGCSSQENLENGVDHRHNDWGNEENNFQAEHLEQSFEIEERNLVSMQSNVEICDDRHEEPRNDFELNLRQCRFCHEYFPYATLWIHKRRCEKAKVHKCSECGKVFRKRSVMLHHKRKHSDERSYHCKICTKSFKYKGGISRHMKDQHGKRQKDLITVPVVDERRENKADCSSHENLTLQNGVDHFASVVKENERCGYEETSFQKEHLRPEQSVGENKEIIVDNKQSKVELCDKREEVRNEFEFNLRQCRFCYEYFPYVTLCFHKRRCEKAKVHKCSECGKVFRKRYAMLDHKRKHSDERAYHCNICTKSFKYKCGISRHIKNRHGERQKNLITLPVVDERRENEGDCSSQENLKENERFRYEDNSFQEEHLEQSCFGIEGSNLDNQEDNDAYSGNKLEEVKNSCELTLRPCRFCNEYFHYATLLFHMERCEKAKVHKCSECEMVFRKPSSLLSHKRKHSDERLFHCEICMKSFKYKGGMTRHMKEQHGGGLRHPSMTVDGIEKNDESCFLQREVDIHNGVDHFASILKGNARFDCEEKNFEEDCFELEENDFEIEESRKDNFELNFGQTRQGTGLCEEDENDVNMIVDEEEGVEMGCYPQEELNLQKDDNHCGNGVNENESYHMEESNFGEENLKQGHSEIKERDLKNQHHIGFCDENAEIISCNDHFPNATVCENRSSDKSHTCEDCGKVFKKRSSMWDHQHKHSDARLFSCRICAKTFKFRSGLGRHIKEQHPGTQIIDAVIVNENTASHLQEGNFNKNGNALKQIVAEIVQEKESYLKKHKIHKCPECPKTFWTPSEMYKHTYKHSDIKSFACKLCPKAFKFRSGLIRHVRKEHNVNGVKRPQNCGRQMPVDGAKQFESSESIHPFEKNVIEQDGRSNDMLNTGDRRDEVSRSCPSTTQEQIHSNDKTITTSALLLPSPSKEKCVNDRLVHCGQARKKPVPYRCNKCEAVFENLCDFLTHQRAHR